MAVRINDELCTGCKNLKEPLCVRICPGDLLYKSQQGRIKIRDKSECWDCAACVKECPNQAIEMYLPAEIGGRGSTLTAKRQQDKIFWNLNGVDGQREEFEVLNISTENVLSHANYIKRRQNYMIEAKIGDKLVGDGHECFISFEPGATHTGLKSAKKLAKAAKEAGADAVKFQTIETDEIMGSKDLMIEYETSEGVVKEESIYDALKRRELSFNEWRELKEYCDQLGILFISTPSGPDTVDLLAELDVAAIKVSKSDINNRYLIKLIAQKGLPVILDAREKFEDVEKACKILEDEGVEDIVIMHCPSGYPAEYSGINLKSVEYIRDIFQYPVAYSDHSVGMYMNFAALGMGVDFIEKTITLDKTTDAVEHYMSLEPDEMEEFVEKIRKAEEAFGDPRIIFNSRVKKQNRRSIMTAREIKAGETITIDDLVFKRPGTYLSVERYEEVIGKKTTKDLEEGIFLSEDDFE